jgi:hypothetical protein
LEARTLPAGWPAPWPTWAGASDLSLEAPGAGLLTVRRGAAEYRVFLDLAVN